jgi:hypothetical protein
MAESLPWSPHWEFGISHWQLVTKLHYLSGKRKTCAGVLARPPSRLLLEIDVGERLSVGVGATRCGWAYRHKRRSTDFGPWRLVTYLRDSPGPGRYRHCGRGWDGRAVSSTVQGGGKRRLEISCLAR